MCLYLRLRCLLLQGDSIGSSNGWYLGFGCPCWEEFEELLSKLPAGVTLWLIESRLHMYMHAV